MANDGRGGHRLIVREHRVVAGRPALVDYSPEGSQQLSSYNVRVRIYDAARESIYIIEGSDPSLRGGPDALERVLAIARSLFESPNAP